MENTTQHIKPVLVIGGGISGITAAVETAEVGHPVILVEKLAYLGGRVVKMNQYFPKLCPPYCGLEINFKRIRQNPKVKVRVSTTVQSISGEKGSYTVTLRTDPALVNTNCTSCDDCTSVCPVERSDEFNYGLGKTKAIYLPHEMAFPFKYAIDESVCLGETCGKCVEACKYNAIDLLKKESISTIEVRSIIFATGWKPYDPAIIPEYKFTGHSDIVTNVEMERLGAPNGPGKGKLVKPSDGEAPGTVVFVQCAGSRDENHLPYCSGVCCGASLKQALMVREQYHDSKVKIFYIDLRVTGRNEDFLKKVEEEPGIELIKGKVANIDIEGDQLMVVAEDILAGKKINMGADLVVLATGMVPEKIDLDLVKVDEAGFLVEHDDIEGIFVAGCAGKPLDVSSSLKGATGAALKAIKN